MSKTILIVDDEKLITNILKYRIETEFGYEVIAVNSGIEAIDILRAQDKKIDLTILDMMMPGLNGLDTLRIIKSDAAINAAKILVLSASGKFEQQARELGCSDYLKKPFKMAEIMEKINKILNIEN